MYSILPIAYLKHVMLMNELSEQSKLVIKQLI